MLEGRRCALAECRRFAARQPDNELEAASGSKLLDNMTFLLRIQCQRVLKRERRKQAI